MPGNTGTPWVACAGAVGSASAAIGAATAASMRNHRRRIMASDLQESRLYRVPVSCGLLFPKPLRTAHAIAHRTTTLRRYTPVFLPRHRVASPAAGGHP